jgi:hypothetical protein
MEFDDPIISQFVAVAQRVYAGCAPRLIEIHDERYAFELRVPGQGCLQVSVEGDLIENSMNDLGRKLCLEAVIKRAIRFSHRS